MSIALKLPGERRDPDSSDPGVGPYANILGTEVIAVADVGAARRGRGAVIQSITAEPDDVLELDWEDGIVELVRAGDLEDQFPEAKRSADGALTIPTRRTVRRATRGTREIGLEGFKQIRVKTAEMALEKVVGFGVPKALRRLEEAHMPHPGLYHVTETGVLGEAVENLPRLGKPWLILLHGTFSDTANSFADLFPSEEWTQVVAAYGERILALEQHTVTESPAGNALQLVSKLPEGAQLHLLSYSRGGLIGDLLCRHEWTADVTEILFADPSYAAIRDQLTKLQRTLARKKLRVERFVRVASPAAGTLLASKRLDAYLNVILTVLGKLAGPAAPAVQFVKALATAIVSTRTRADALPGIEAMMPHTDRGFVPFLNLAEPRGNDLAVIAGDVRGGGLWDRVKDFFSHLYYWEDNDFVVDSRSMFRGVPRDKARAFYYRSPRADHFSYFGEPETRSRMAEWLLQGREERFQMVDAARPYGGMRGAPASRAIPSLAEIEAKREGDRPVVFLIPGIMGTHLAYDGQRHWIHVLRMAWGGLAKLEIGAAGISPDGLIDMVYERLFDRLAREYHVIPFGYDWRLSIEAAAIDLGKLIEREIKDHRNPVRIVGHSMGGLVARAFVLARPDLWAEMKRRNGRLIMLGTPNFGSYVPAQVFTKQHKLMKIAATADLRNSLDDLTHLVRAFPGLVEMLPLKGAMDLLDPARWQGFGEFVPSPGVLGSARAFRDRLEAGPIDPDHMVYVAGHAEATPAMMERVGREVVFRYTGRGDGTVPWDLGFLNGVDTYYVDAEHGQIANHPPAFDGFLELLERGRTRKLDATPPVVQRAMTGDELFDLEPDEEPDQLRYYPNAADFIAAIAGQPPDPEKDRGPPLHVEVTAGDLREAKYPVLVGHYRGDGIVSAEAVLDRELGGALSRHVQLGRYPGQRGTVRLFLAEKIPAEKAVKGVVVTGLGDVGSLHRSGLEEVLGAALTEFALAKLADPSDAATELRISSLLVGTYGGTGIGVDEAMSALVDAALTTNARLDEQGLGHRARFHGIEIIELYLDVAIAAGRAARAIADRHGDLVTAAPSIRQRVTCRRSRPESPYAEGWSRRIRVRQKDTKVTFEVTTDLARSEPYQRSIQQGLLNSLLETVTENDREAASTLFQYLLPHQLIDQASNMPDVVLDLDPALAAIPWEILHPPGSRAGGRAPLGVRVGLLRTLSTPDRRENPRRGRGRRALVVGEPAGVKPPLPGARKEAEYVAHLLSGHNMTVEPLIGASGDEIFRALYREEYDIIHIAAHGEFNDPAGADAEGDRQPSAADGPPNARPSGVILGDGRYLTSGEFENLRAVPSIVFLNCCHLARMESLEGRESRSLRQPSRLAASVAEELIKMGVGVVVAAGWAVSDAAAEVFANALYTELLGGRTLMKAVSEARRRAYGAGGSGDLTWGAYQVYGDPGTMLHWADPMGDESGPGDRSFVSPEEVVEYISDFSPRGRGAGDDHGLRDTLLGELTRLEHELPEAWLARGGIRAALGRAYADLAIYPEAIEHYRRAASQSDAPMETVEQLANIEGRYAARIAKSDPTRAEELFHSSVKRLRGLCEAGDSSERRCLIGATLRRRARVTTNRKLRSQYIEEARSEYEAACKLEPPNLYYPLSNKVALDISLDPTRVAPAELEAIVASAESCDDEWSRAAKADAMLIGFLALEEGNAEAAAQAYQRAMTGGAGATRRERDSMLDQVAALVDLALDEGVQQRAEQVRSILRGLP